MASDHWEVLIAEQGRAGVVTYRESNGEIRCYWEFGGGDVVAIVSVGRIDDWQRDHPWAAPRRQLILSRIATEVIRQRAPGSRADLDERLGAIHIRPLAAPVPPGEITIGGPKPPRSPDAWFWKRSSMMTKLALLVGIVVIALALGRSMLTIRTTGAPWGASARAGDVILTLMTRLEPYVPSLNRNHGNDRYTMGLLVQSARDPSVRKFVEISTGNQAANLSLSRITEVEGDRVWFRAPEQGWYDLKSGKVTYRPSNARPLKASTMADLATGDDALRLWLVAGGYPEPSRWLGVLSESEARSGFRTGSKPSQAYPLERSKEPRVLWTTGIDRTGGDPRIAGLEQVDATGYLNGAFLRASREGEILRLDGDGFLLIWESKPYRAGTIMAARIGFDGKPAWTVDTGIGSLHHLLPDPALPALVGERPRIPDKVSEPIVVVVDARTGSITTRSLWLR